MASLGRTLPSLFWGSAILYGGFLKEVLLHIACTQEMQVAGFPLKNSALETRCREWPSVLCVSVVFEKILN